MVSPRPNGPASPRGPWRLRVLGPVEIDFAGERLEVQGVARALLALLTRSAGQVVSVESLVDGLWGSTPPAGAERAVASYVSRLRKALANAGVNAPPVVLTRAPGYLLAVDPADVDLADFESRVAEGRRAAAVGQPALAEARLRQALALWRGEAYADVGEVAFAPIEARRLAELRLAAIESRVEAELAAAAPIAPPTLAGELQLLVAEHPHRERLWAHLIMCLYRQGQQADALATYQRARARLVEDLGVEPGGHRGPSGAARTGPGVRRSGRGARLPRGRPGRGGHGIRSGQGACRRAWVREDPARGRTGAPGCAAGRSHPIRRRSRRACRARVGAGTSGRSSG